MINAGVFAIVQTIGEDKFLHIVGEVLDNDEAGYDYIEYVGLEATADIVFNRYGTVEKFTTECGGTVSQYQTDDIDDDTFDGLFDDDTIIVDEDVFDENADDGTYFVQN